MGVAANIFTACEVGSTSRKGRSYLFHPSAQSAPRVDEQRESLLSCSNICFDAVMLSAKWYELVTRIINMRDALHKLFRYKEQTYSAHDNKYLNVL